MKPLGLYVHIPFCVKKCNYCDFLSAPANEEIRARYVEMLCREIESYRSRTTEYELKTIYFGGGTPSVLDAEQIEQIWNTIRKCFTVAMETAEVTLEVNPGTVNEEKLRRYRELGINRLSIGVQSTKAKELKLLGRIHTFEDAKNTVRWARNAGFTNLSLDLISALPGQSFADYQENVEEILKLQPEHISSYSLIIEEGTPFYELYGEGMKKESDLPKEETDRAMYGYTKERLLAAGYMRYEISNYAKPGYESKHNSSYWTGQDYIGAGLGASSLFRNVRYQNETNLFTYLKEVEAGADIRRETERLEPAEQMEEYMILGLRRMCGVSREEFKNRFGQAMETIYGDVLEKLNRDGLIFMEGDRIALTELGIDVSNYVFVQFVP